MSESGKVIATHTHVVKPRHLSVSDDDIIYFADMETGVYQSTDDGVSWTLVFKPIGRQILQVIKVKTVDSDNFLSIACLRELCRLRAFFMDRRSSDVKLTWQDSHVPQVNDITNSLNTRMS